VFEPVRPDICFGSFPADLEVDTVDGLESVAGAAGTMAWYYVHEKKEHSILIRSDSKSTEDSTHLIGHLLPAFECAPALQVGRRWHTRVGRRRVRCE
jgi:hypothetical protein